MKTSLVVCLLALVLAACGGSNQAGPRAVCREWEHLKVHPGKDPIKALEDLIQRTTSADQAKLLMAMQDDGIHNRRSALEVDQLRVDRYCAGL